MADSIENLSTKLEGFDAVMQKILDKVTTFESWQSSADRSLSAHQGGRRGGSASAPRVDSSAAATATAATTSDPAGSTSASDVGARLPL
jgi:hypothetical protein